MKIRGQSGFTIVELLIGMIAALILALMAGVMLINTYRGWVRSLAAADMERDTAVALHALDLAVRGAVDTVLTGPNTLQVRMTNGMVRAFSAQWAGAPPRGSLYYYPVLGGPGMTLVDKRLDSFGTTVTADVVRVTMTLRGIDQNNADTTVTMGVTNMCIRLRN